MNPDHLIDPMLQLLVKVMNGTGGQMGITVVTGGTCVAGTLISPRMFTQELGDLLTEKAGEGGSGLRVFFEKVGQQWFPSESERDAGLGDEGVPDAAPQFLHLRGARIFVGDNGIPVEGCYLRLRLDTVEGWTIGELGPPGSEPAVPPPARG